MEWNRRKHCPECHRNVLARRCGPNLGLHSMLMLLTCGLYLPIWLWVMFRVWWLCPKCGRSL